MYVGENVTEAVPIPAMTDNETKTSICQHRNIFLIFKSPDWINLQPRERTKFIEAFYNIIARRGWDVGLAIFW